MSAPTVDIGQLFSLEDRVFLVAGGARNLGRDMAEALAQAGAHGAVTSRNSESARQAAMALAAATNQPIEGLALDATDEASVVSVVKSVLQRFGRIDVLVNCVGGGATSGPAGLEDRKLADWEQLLRTNTTAPFLLCKHVVGHMRQRHSGCIINIASIAGMVGRDRRVYPPGMAPQSLDYAAAKGAVISFTRDLAAYAGRDGVRVNCVSPGGFARNQPEAFRRAYSDKCILGRMGQDGVDIKGVVVFLASEASAYVTGQNIVVDGGFTVWQ